MIDEGGFVAWRDSGSRLTPLEAHALGPAVEMATRARLALGEDVEVERCLHWHACTNAVLREPCPQLTAGAHVDEPAARREEARRHGADVELQRIQHVRLEHAQRLPY